MTSVSAYARLRFRFVSLVYADHNRSASVRRALHEVLTAMPANGMGLNVGAGETRLDARIRNLDIFPGPNIDYVGFADAIPLPNASLDLVISQETLEHVADPFKAMVEIHRVLKPGGTLYLQLPFTIGYHPGPTDFWRFTREGIVRLAESSGLRIERVGVAVGSSTGFYRVSVEYFAILLSLPLHVLYVPLKAFFAVVFFPLKWLDGLTDYSHQNDRLAGGYFVIARKAAT